MLLIPVFIVLNLQVRVLLDHLVFKPMVLPLILLRVDAALQDVPLLNLIAIKLLVLVEIYLIAQKMTVL